MPGPTPKWLKEYYGKEVDDFSPSVVYDGIKKAVVRIQRGDISSASSSIGYVLLSKSGRHNATHYRSLFEGIPAASDLAAMKAALDADDH